MARPEAEEDVVELLESSAELSPTLVRRDEDCIQFPLKKLFSRLLKCPPVLGDDFLAWNIEYVYCLMYSFLKRCQGGRRPTNRSLSSCLIFTSHIAEVQAKAIG